MDASRWVSGGFVVSRRTRSAAALPTGLFPESIVSASEHVAPILPSVPVGWLEAANAPPGRFAKSADRYMGNVLWGLVSDLQRFGLESSGAAILADCLSDAGERGDFVEPSGFASVDAARSFLRLAGDAGEDAIILGLALPDDAVDDVMESSDGLGFVPALLGRDESATCAGDVLGYEVLGVNDGELVSWVEELAAQSLPALGVTVNQNGLLATLEDARAVAALANGGDVTTEDEVFWAPWRICAFSVHDDALAPRRSDAA